MNNITELDSDDKLISFAETLYEAVGRSRFKWVRQGFENNRFYNGDHYGYNKYGVTSINGFPLPNKYGRVVQWSTAITDAKMNMVLEQDPIPVVSKKLDEKDLVKASRDAQSIERKLSKFFDDEQLNIKRSMVVHDALLQRTAYFELYTDSTGLHIGTLPFYNVLLPPETIWIKKAPIIGKVFSANIGDYINHSDYKNVEFVKPNKNYLPIENTNTDQIVEAFKISVNNLNQFTAVEWQSAFCLTAKDIGKIKKLDKTKYAWIDKKEPGDKIMRIFTTCSGYVIRDQYIDCDTYYIYPYCPQEGPLYGPAFFRRLMSANKSYDNLVSVLEEYASYSAKYNLLLEKGSIVSELNNTAGLKIFYDGEPPIQMKHNDLPNGVFELINKLEYVMGFVSNVSPSTMGMSMSGSKKFKAMETQKQADMFNTRPMIVRLKNTLLDLTKGVLDIMSNSIETEKFSFIDNNKQTQNVTLVGENYNNYNKTASNVRNKYDTVIISKDFPVDIEIGQGLDYTDNSVQSQLFEMAKSGAIPVKVWLRAIDKGKFIDYLDEEVQKPENQLGQDTNKPNNQSAPSGAPATPGALPGGPTPPLPPSPIIPNQQPMTQPGGLPPIQPPQGNIPPQLLNLLMGAGGPPPLPGQGPLPPMPPPQMGPQIPTVGIPPIGANVPPINLISSIPGLPTQGTPVGPIIPPIPGPDEILQMLNLGKRKKVKKKKKRNKKK